MGTIGPRIRAPTELRFFTRRVGEGCAWTHGDELVWSRLKSTGLNVFYILCCVGCCDLGWIFRLSRSIFWVQKGIKNYEKLLTFVDTWLWCISQYSFMLRIFVYNNNFCNFVAIMEHNLFNKCDEYTVRVTGEQCGHITFNVTRSRVCLWYYVIHNYYSYHIIMELWYHIIRGCYGIIWSLNYKFEM